MASMAASGRRLLIAFTVALSCTPSHAADAAAPAGLAVFDRVCAACHQAGGKGLVGLAPALAGTLPFIGTDDGRRYVAQVLVHGLSGRISSQGQVFNLAMPPQAALTDADLAEVANYLARDLNAAATSPFGAQDLAQARAAKPGHKELREWRERLLK